MRSIFSEYFWGYIVSYQRITTDYLKHKKEKAAMFMGFLLGMASGVFIALGLAAIFLL
jgi:hypothetical protein